MRRRNTANFQPWSLCGISFLAAGNLATSAVEIPRRDALTRIVLRRLDAFSQAIFVGLLFEADLDFTCTWSISASQAFTKQIICANLPDSFAKERSPKLSGCLQSVRVPSNARTNIGRVSKYRYPEMDSVPITIFTSGLVGVSLNSPALQFTEVFKYRAVHFAIEFPRFEHVGSASLWNLPDQLYGSPHCVFYHSHVARTSNIEIEELHEWIRLIIITVDPILHNWSDLTPPRFILIRKLRLQLFYLFRK